MACVLALMYGLSFLLPVIGLCRLYLLARKDAKALDAAPKTASGAGISHGQRRSVSEILVPAVIDRPKQVIWDLALIGFGLAFGAAAAIISLFT